MAADEKGILRMVEDKLTQLLGKVIRKEPAMMNRPPLVGAMGMSLCGLLVMMCGCISTVVASGDTHRCSRSYQKDNR